MFGVGLKPVRYVTKTPAGGRKYKLGALGAIRQCLGPFDLEARLAISLGVFDVQARSAVSTGVFDV